MSLGLVEANLDVFDGDFCNLYDRLIGKLRDNGSLLFHLQFNKPLVICLLAPGSSSKHPPRQCLLSFSSKNQIVLQNA